MGNVTTGNPWVLDTAATIKTKGNLVKIKKMMFYAAAAGDDVAVTDGGGNAIWKTRAAAAGTNYEDYAGVPFEPPEPLEVSGFIVSTIDGAGSGELWVWLA